MAKKKTAKKPTSTSDSEKHVLTADQQKKIRKLLKSKDAKNIKLAVGLLEKYGATADDVSDVFSTSIISLLVNTWDVDVWNVLAPLLTENPCTKQEFTNLVGQRILKKSKPFVTSFSVSLFERVGVPLGQLLTESATLQKVGKFWVNSPRPVVTEISDAGAQLLLMSGKGHYIRINDLTSLSDAAAESLSKLEGDLSLSGLTNISDTAAEKLSNHEGALSLNGLISLSDAAAEKLSNHVGALSLNGLISLSDAAAESLSKLKGILGLNGVTNLSDAASESLSNHEDPDPKSASYALLLGGLTQLSAVAAESLRKHEGIYFGPEGVSKELFRLTTLSNEAGINDHVLTEEFVRIKLTPFSNYSSITPEAAALIVKQLPELLSGTIYVGSQSGLTGLTELPESVVECFCSYNGPLDLSGLTNLPDETAEGLGKHTGSLNLSGLMSLSNTAANHLAKHNGELIFKNLTSISDITAACLAKHKSLLDLSGLTSISDSVAKSLSTHQGELILNGVISLSETSAASLGQCSDGLSLHNLQSISDRSAVALQKPSIGVSHEIRDQIKSAAKKLARKTSTLDPKQQANVRKLLKTKEPGNVALACELLTVAEASDGDWLMLFPKTRIRALLATSSPEIWNTLAKTMNSRKVFEVLAEEAKRRVKPWTIEYDLGMLTADSTALAERLVEILSSDASKNNVLLKWRTQFMSELSDQDSESLSKHEGHLDLDSLTALSDAAAKSLGKHAGQLRLAGLSNISDASAESLSKHEGELLLNGLTELSDPAAESLGTHVGRLWLDGLAELSDAAAESLGKHEGGCLGLSSLTELSDTAARSLAKTRPNFERWSITLANLPASAAQILRDAGHGE